MSEAESRARLQSLRAEIERISELGAEAAGVVKLDQSKVGRLSRMDALQAQAVAGRRAEMLRNIDAALKRLDAGDYGYCRRCEEPIAPRRLEVDPTALLCIRCATAAED